jgi:hypothetical protein
MGTRRGQQNFSLTHLSSQSDKPFPALIGSGLKDLKNR